MKKTILISISLIVAVCGILIVYRFSTQKPVGLAANEVLAPNEAQPLKEWINNSIDDAPLDMFRVISGLATRNAHSWNRHGQMPRRTSCMGTFRA